jgi:Cu-processing system permease protein
MFSTSYLYNSTEFIELLLGQPIKRRKIWVSLFLGLSGALCLAFLLGIGLPILIYAFDRIGVMMILIGILISIIFVSLSMLCSILTRDKAKGMGFSIILWLFFSLLFDGLVLFLLFQLSDYPIEKMMVGISAFNPIDLSRILLLMQTDASAMMGYTGAIFQQFFGTRLGMTITFTLLCLWALLPFSISLRKFKHKDL